MRLPPEIIEQIKVHEWVKQRTNLPFIHVPNEAKRSPSLGAVLKRMGLRAGVSDIFIPRAKDNFHGLWIELKMKGNRPTENQLQFIADMKNEGYEAMVCYESAAAIEAIKNFYQL
jgi:hypothetical protein